MRFRTIVIGFLTVSCDVAAFLVSGSLNGRNASSERFAMSLHVLNCRGCRRFARQMKFHRGAMTRLRKRPQDDDAPHRWLLPLEVRERIKVALKEASNPPSALPGGMFDLPDSID
jgi:hypothetical protein